MTDEEIDIIQREFSWDGRDMAVEIAHLRAEIERIKQSMQRTVHWLVEQRKKIQRDLDATVGYKLAESGE